MSDREEFVVDEDNEDIVTLAGPDGEEVDFVEIAGVEVQDKFYCILQPVELLEGMEEDEALVFEVTEGEEEDSFRLVMDDDVIDAVFAEYERMLDELDEASE